MNQNVEPNFWFKGEDIWYNNYLNQLLVQTAGALLSYVNKRMLSVQEKKLWIFIQQLFEPVTYDIQ